MKPPCTFKLLLSQKLPVSHLERFHSFKTNACWLDSSWASPRGCRPPVEKSKELPAAPADCALLLVLSCLGDYMEGVRKTRRESFSSCSMHLPVPDASNLLETPYLGEDPCAQPPCLRLFCLLGCQLGRREPPGYCWQRKLTRHQPP